MPKREEFEAHREPMSRSEIAARGGAAVPAEKRSFSLNRTLARSAGRKGGALVKPENRSFFTNPELAQRAGRLGVEAKRKKRAMMLAGGDEDKDNGYPRPAPRPSDPVPQPKPGSQDGCE